MSRSGALRKVTGDQRTISPAETLERAWPVARALGVTRLADITGLDRIGIPTYSAVIPRSRDGLSITNGKGIARIDAQVGALMEAIERQTACQVRLPLVYGSLDTLRRTRAVLDPRELKYKLLPDYSETLEYSWIVGRDFLSGEEVLVPSQIGGYLWRDVPGKHIVGLGSSNGLASGNIREEAVFQALCELIERDAWTLAHLGAHLLPLTRRRLADPENAAIGPDDFEMFASLEDMDDEASRLFRAAGLHPIMHDITSDLRIPTVMAVVPDDSFPGVSMVHAGTGTHPDARVAVRRALTEAAQSRCVDIQGVREDISNTDSAKEKIGLHTQRVAAINRNFWTLGRSRQARCLEEMPTAVHDDVGEDLDHILQSLGARSITRVVVIDFSPPDANFAVVRVIVPELENASIHHGPVGERALQFWRSHA